MRLNNVKVTLDRQKYPCSYLITVGPKSQFIKEKHLELFDPYVSATAENIVYDKVFVNGEEIDDLTPYIKQVEFDNLYPSALPFGKGKIISVSKEKKQ